MPKLMATDPLGETDAILKEHFYGRSERTAARAVPVRRPAKPKPSHYKIMCISLYNRDIDRLEALVAELKRQGHSKANKSALIRFALDTVDIAKMPKGY